MRAIITNEFDDISFISTLPFVADIIYVAGELFTHLLKKLNSIYVAKSVAKSVTERVTKSTLTEHTLTKSTLTESTLIEKAQ